MNSEAIYSNRMVSPWPDPAGDEGLRIVSLRRHINRLENLIGEALSEQMPISARTRHDEVVDWYGIANLLKFARSVESIEADASALDGAPPMCSALMVMDERMSLISSRFTGAMVVFQFSFSALENTVWLCDTMYPQKPPRRDLADRVPPHLEAIGHLAAAMPGFAEIAASFEAAIAETPSCLVRSAEGATTVDMVEAAFAHCRRWRNLLAHGRIELPSSMPGVEEEEDFAEAEQLVARFHLGTRLTLLITQLLVLRCVEGKDLSVGEEFGAEALYDGEDTVPMDRRLLELHQA